MASPTDRDFEDVERAAHRALRALPPVRAPHSLAPRVMRAIALAQQPDSSMARWFDGSMAWRSWRLEWQLLSLICACSLLAAIALALPLAQTWIEGLTTTRAVAAFWQMFLAPIAMPIVVLTGVMCTACALIVAALKHVAWEGREMSH